MGRPSCALGHASWAQLASARSSAAWDSDPMRSEAPHTSERPLTCALEYGGQHAQKLLLSLGRASWSCGVLELDECEPTGSLMWCCGLNIEVDRGVEIPVTPEA